MTVDYAGIVGRAVPALGIDVRSVELLSHSENLVFAVTAENGQRYAARLHRPGYNSPREMESEVAWVRALSEGGVAVPLALPIAAGDHDDEPRHYVTVEITPSDRRQLGLIEWVDGTALGSVTSPSGADGADPDTPVTILTIGRAVPKKGHDDLLDALSKLPAACAR